MNKKNLILTAVIAMAITAGCGNSISETEAVASETPAVETEVTEPIVIEAPVEEVVAEEVPEAVDPVESETVEFTSVSKLTGRPVEDSILEVRPAVVMLDNHYGARPQAGLNEADHIYEMLAEGRITRYMAVFQSGSPSPVGPVRSARPYFIDKALEYDAYYVHVGGSMQAMTDIINLNMADIDGLSSGAKVFWRTRHKKNST